jgi:hypothetical protein
MEYMLYLKSIMFILIISFACLLDNAAVVGNVRATQETNNYYGCYSSTSNNNNNSNEDGDDVIAQQVIIIITATRTETPHTTKQ